MDEERTLYIQYVKTSNRTLAGCESVTDRDSTTHNTPCWNNDHLLVTQAKQTVTTNVYTLR